MKAFSTNNSNNSRKTKTLRDVFCLCSALMFLLATFTFPAQAQSAPKKITPQKEFIDPELRQHLKNVIETSESFVDRFDAEVWLVSKSSRLERFIKDPEKRLTLLRSIHRAATEAKLQPEIVLSVIEVESHFDRFAISHAGAQGMMQVMPFWKKEIGRPDDNLFNLETNLRYGCTILKHYIDKEEGRLAPALARYNGSYGSYRYSEKVMNAWQNRWK